MCVVAIGVGVVAAGEVISGRFKKGVEFDAKRRKRKSHENVKIYEKVRT